MKQFIRNFMKYDFEFVLLLAVFTVLYYISGHDYLILVIGLGVMGGIAGSYKEKYLKAMESKPKTTRK